MVLRDLSEFGERPTYVPCVGENEGLDASIANDLQRLKKMVGGWVEFIRVGDYYFVCNEEGRDSGLPTNEYLTQYGLQIFGDAVVVPAELVI